MCARLRRAIRISRALVGGQKNKVAWCFDLLEIDGRDLRPFRWGDARRAAQSVIEALGGTVPLRSEVFPDAAKLLDACDARGLEDIVSKRRTDPTGAAKIGGGESEAPSLAGNRQGSVGVVPQTVVGSARMQLKIFIGLDALDAQRMLKRMARTAPAGPHPE